MSHPHNPFSTSAVRPGAIPYLADEEFIDTAIFGWQRVGWVGQLVGPHGVGKTSLAMTMATRINSEFNSVKRITFRSDGIMSWRTKCEVISVYSKQESGFQGPGVQVSVARQDRKTYGHPRKLWIVDGLERINGLHRWLLVGHCRRRQIGLLISSHRRLAGVPVLATLAPSPEIFRRVAEHLLTRDARHKEMKEGFDAATMQIAYEKAGGNLREGLMLLYDCFETRQKRRYVAALGQHEI